MIRLAIETTTDRLTVAASADGRIATREAPGSRLHASLLGPLALEVLGQLGVGLDRVDRLLVADGPGSFTGLRIGVAWAKAVGLAVGAELAVASTLLVRAARVATEQPTAVLGVGSALRGELYLAGYQLSRGRVETVLRPTVVTPGAPLPGFQPARIVSDLEPEKLAPWPWAAGVEIVGPPEGLPHAATLLDLDTWHDGTITVADRSGWEPDYGRPAEAQARWERDHGRSLVDSLGHGSRSP